MSRVYPMREAALKEMAPVEGVNSVSERVQNAVCISAPVGAVNFVSERVQNAVCISG